MSIQRIPIANDAGRAFGLEPGVSLSFKVLSSLGQGRYLLSSKGGILTAYSETPLKPGERFLARLLARGDTLSLERLGSAERGDGAAPKAGAAGILLSLGLGRSDRNLAMVLAFRREGLALDPPRIRRLASFLAALPEDRRDEAASFIARIEAAGGEVTEALVADFVADLEAGDRRGGSGGEGGGKKGREHAGQDRAGQDQAGRDLAGRDLAGDIAAIVDRLLPDGDKGAALGLFNALARSGRWVYKPYTLSLDGLELRGTFRIYLSEEGRKGIVAADIGLREGLYGFSLGFTRSEAPGGASRLRLFADSRSMQRLKAALPGLERRLVGRGVALEGEPRLLMAGFERGGADDEAPAVDLEG